MNTKIRKLKENKIFSSAQKMKERKKYAKIRNNKNQTFQQHQHIYSSKKKNH
jgi:hypothetical protein